MSREGLYVSANRGREAIRVFVPDRAAFLDVAELKSETRMSALEFERQRITGMEIQAVLARSWRHLLRVRSHYGNRLSLRPMHETSEELVEHSMKITTPRAVPPRPSTDEDHDRRHVIRPRQSAPRIHMG